MDGRISMKKYNFIPKMFYKLLIPSLISSFAFALSDMVDALVVGQTMGTTGLAAISLCLPIYMFINVITDGLAIGGSIKFSQELGGGNKESAAKCFGMISKSAIYISVLFAILVNVFPKQVLSLLGAGQTGTELYHACERYMRILSAGAPLLMLNIILMNFLRNDNNEVIAAKGFMIGNITDIVLNIILVIGFKQGTIGAAISTVTGSMVAILCYLPGVIGNKANVLKVENIKIDIKQTFGCFRSGFSTSARSLFMLLFLLVTNRIMMDLNGEYAVAVFDVVYNVSFFIIYLCDGTAEALQPIVSTFTGERSEEDCETVKVIARKYAIILAGVVALLLVVFAKELAGVFGITEEHSHMAVRAIRIYCIGFAFLALNIIYSKYCQSKGLEKCAFFNVLLQSLVVAVPSIYICSMAGLKYVWYAFPLTEAITFIIFAIYYILSCKKVQHFDEARIMRTFVENEDDAISRLLDQSEEFCDSWNADTNQKYCVMLIIEEIVASISRNVLNDSDDGVIRVTLLAMEDGDFTLNVLDNATDFNPFSITKKKKIPDTDFDIDEISMALIKKKTKKYMYRRCYGFNSLVVRI